MNHKKNIAYIMAASFLMAVIGFILDLHERVDSIFTNIFEIIMMTLLIFTIIIFFYGIITFLSKIIPENKDES